MNEILLYGSIGQDWWGMEDSITAKSVRDQLANIDGDVTVRISSGGGEVYEGIDIMTELKNHPGEVTVIVESLAASAASFIAVGGADKILMRDTSEMMIHRAQTWVDGNADEVERTLGDLKRQDLKLAKIYAARAGGEVEDWLAAMSEETWYSAQEAVDAGLADGLVSATAAAPVEARRLPSFSASMKKFKYAGRSAAPPPMIPTNSTPRDGQRGNKMNVLNQLAQELGKEPDEVRGALAKFLNETVTISEEVEITYPVEAPIAPTERITVDPVVGEAGDASGLGLNYEMGDIAEGYIAEVDANSGQVTITAPSGVEVGAVANFTVTVSGTAVALSTKVRSLSEPAEVAPQEEPTPDSPVNLVIPAGMSMVPTDHLTHLNEIARNFSSQQAELEEAAAKKRVDTDIRDGRFSPANRAAALAVLRTDPQLYEKSWGSQAKNTINMVEAGHGVEVIAESEAKDVPQGTPEERLAAYTARVKNKK